MLAVAGADSSRQCSYAHREWARAEKVSEHDLAAIEQLDFDALDERTWLALAWAQAHARSDLGQVPADLDVRFRELFSAQERADVELAARTMYWLNETSNSVDAFLWRLKRTQVLGSTRSSELVSLVLYALALPALISLFSVKQRRNPFSILGGMRPFFHDFETRGPNTISGAGRRFGDPTID